MLGLGRPPEVRYKAVQAVTPRLQRLLDTLEAMPRPRSGRPPGTSSRGTGRGGRGAGRTTARCRRGCATSCVWFSTTRASAPRRTIGSASPVSWSAAFRADAARAGAVSEIAPTRRGTVATPARNSRRCGGTTTSTPMARVSNGSSHPVLGAIEMEYSAFAVDGRPDLGMIVYNPVAGEVAERIRALVAARRRDEGAPPA